MTAWMLYAVALGGLLSVAAAAAETGLRALRRPSRWVWAAALLGSLLLPVAASLRPAPPAAAVAVPVTTFVEVESLADARLPVAATPVREPLLRRAEPLLPVAWALASGVLLLTLAISSLRLAFHRRAWRMAVIQGEAVLVSEHTGPAVAGALRPSIVLPAWALELEEAELRIMLAHEREHIRARDPLLLSLAWIAAALLPWSPFVWLQLRRLRLAVELDCDARVLRGGHDLAAYGGLLLRVGERVAASRLPVAAMAEPRSFLARRIRAMTGGARSRLVPLFAVVGLTSSSAAAWALPAVALTLSRHPAVPSGPELEAAVVTPVRMAAATPPPVDSAGEHGPLGGSADTLPVYPPTQLDNPPVLLNPDEGVSEVDVGRRLGKDSITGHARLAFIVEVDGTVRSAVVLEGENPRVAEALREAVLRRRYSPGMLRGAPVRTRLSNGVFIGERTPIARAPLPNDPDSAYARGRRDGAAAARAMAPALAEIARRHPEVKDGDPVTVFLIRDSAGAVLRSVVLPNDQIVGTAGDFVRRREPGGVNFSVHTTEASLPSSPAPDVVAQIDPNLAFRRLEIWKSSVLPVAVAWITVRN